MCRCKLEPGDRPGLRWKERGGCRCVGRRGQRRERAIMEGGQAGGRSGQVGTACTKETMLNTAHWMYLWARARASGYLDAAKEEMRDPNRLPGAVAGARRSHARKGGTYQPEGYPGVHIHAVLAASSRVVWLQHQAAGSSNLPNTGAAVIREVVWGIGFERAVLWASFLRVMCGGSASQGGWENIELIDGLAIRIDTSSYVSQAES